MMFPKIWAALKEFRSGLGSDLVSLNLKSGNAEFNTTNVDWYARNGYPQIYQALSGGAPSWSSEFVSRETALQHSAVWACNRIISETIGYLPASLMQVKNGEKRHATEHPMYLAMKDAPNDEITAQAFSETLTSHCLLEGGGFAKITRRSGTGVAINLDLLLPEQVLIDREKTTPRKALIYVVKIDGEPDKSYAIVPGKPQDIFHMRGLGWDGIRGYSVIQMGRQSIGTALAAERNVGRFYANGARLPYVLEMEGRFENDTEFQKFRTNWDATYSDSHKAMILEEGKKYKAIGSTMADAQASEFRQFTVSEIARWFSVSPDLIADLSRATFSNIEHLSLRFVKLTLLPWLSRWEQDFKRCVLTPGERAAGYYLHHNLDALLRGDFKTRMEGYSIALQNSFLNPDEVRDLEDRNPLPNGAGQSYHFQMNMQTTPGTGEPTIVEQGVLNRSSSPQGAKDMLDVVLEIEKIARESKPFGGLRDQIDDEVAALAKAYQISDEVPEGIETKRGNS